MLTHPAVAFANIYTCLIYGLYYTFFESFPRVYLGVYHFTYMQTGLAFSSITLGALLGTLVFLPWAFRWAKLAKSTPPASRPERCLVPGLYASFVVPCGLLIFGMFRDALQQQGTRALTWASMDVARRDTLVGQHARGMHVQRRRHRHPAMSRQLPHPRVQGLRGVAVCWKRPDASVVGGGRCRLQSTAVRPSGSEQGRVDLGGWHRGRHCT